MVLLQAPQLRDRSCPRSSIACSTVSIAVVASPVPQLVGVHGEVPQRAVVVGREQVEPPPSVGVAAPARRRRARRAPAPSGPARRRRGTGTGRAGTRGAARPGWPPARGPAAPTGRRGSPHGTCAHRGARACPARQDGLQQQKSGLTVCLVRRAGWPACRPTARVPQEERTRAMRQRLLDATVECLVERGWSGTSTTLVSQRAGVSRGAQLHHFPTKNDLVLAAVEHLSARRGGTSSQAAAAELPTGPRRTRAVLEMLARPLHRPGVRRRARAVGRGPHRRRAAGGRRPARAADRPGDAPLHRRAARRRRVRAGRPRAGAGHPRPGPRPRPGQHDHRRHRPPRPDPRRVGRTSSTRAEAAAR